MDFTKFRDNFTGYGPAKREAENSRLPGLHNGPGDAYRHIIGAAEATRRHGETATRAALADHEDKSDRKGRPAKERKMDDHNNEIGIAIGRRAITYDEVVRQARVAIDAAVKREGSGRDGTALWLERARWNGNPEAPNWPPDWSRVGPSTEPYDYGDERYRNPKPGEPSFFDMPVGSWSEDDVRAVMASDAYRQAGHPAQAETHARVRAWFERAYGNRPVRRDATGRQIDGPSRQPRIDAAGAAGGPVHVRAHSRERGRVDVDAHDRRPPSR